MSRIKVAILGSGNIGIDLLVKIMRAGSRLEIAALAGIDPASEGLAFANRAGIATTSDGIDGLRALPVYPDIRIVFDATSAGAHQRHDAILRADGKRIVDLTPAHIGPFVVPVANLDDHLDAPNINMVTCGGQATIPMVRAISDVVSVHYGEIVASIASRSAGPGTRANIDEFTQTTSAAIETIGRARRGKAIIILNPADPPLVMRNTVLTLSEEGDRGRIRESIAAMSEKVAAYVPGYRLKQEVQFESVGNNAPLNVPGIGHVSGLKTTVFLEVTGAGHHLPAFAGNLDIMTSAARAAGERLAQHILGSQP